MNIRTRKLVWSSFFIILGIIFPQIIHMLGGQMLSSWISPMHIPVLLAGLTLGPLWGLIVGVVTPLFSTFLTGMPPMMPPIFFMMAFELGAYGLLSGFLYSKLRKNIFISLIISMLVGRVAFGFALLIAGPVFGFNPPFWMFMQGVVASAVPAVIIQLLFLPLFVERIRPVKQFSENMRTVGSDSKWV